VFRRLPEPNIVLDGDAVQLDGPDLEVILGEVARRCGDDAEIVRAERVILGGVGGFFGRESFVVTARPGPSSTAPVAGGDDLGTGRADDAGVWSDPGWVDSGESGGVVDGASFAAALAEALARRGEANPIAALPTIPAIPGAHPDPPAGPIEGIDQPEQDPMNQDPADRGAAPDMAAQLPVVPAAVHLALPELPLGELLERVEAIAPRPVTPPARGIVAVVGDAEDALLTAQRLAAHAGQDPAEGVVLMAPEARDGQASWMVVSSPEQAAQRRRRWARRAGTTFVAVTLDPGSTALAWVQRAIEALEPAQIRAAAPAWRCAAELTPRLAALGRVDAVDLVHLASAVEPGEFLLVDPPVSTLDGRPADPGLWAAHLMAAPTPQVTMELLGGIDSPAGRTEVARAALVPTSGVHR
jgi:hypothetical protein